MPAVIPLVLLTLATSAQPASVALEVRGPGGCPGQPWVAARLSQLLQRPAVDPGSARAARLRVIPEGAGLVATVRLDGGERVLRTATRDCPALLDAATLALAVALDPIRGLALQA
ncbi:MAG: hypothetical protein KC613_15115, partial [Myxococcales bacterium]|nr:hypothetical protein [Myxococcales bacterium]